MDCDSLRRSPITTSCSEGRGPSTCSSGSVSWAMYPNRMKRWMGLKTGMDTMFLDYDHDARKAYEDRTTGE